MRHNVFGNPLGRNTKQARALYRSLVREVLDHTRVETTLAKAKAVQAMVDRVITLAKKNSVNAKREISKILGGDTGLDKLFSEAKDRFAARNSGYTRIIRLGQRFSDTTEKVLFELVDNPKEVAVVEPKAAVKKVTKKPLQGKKNDHKTV